MKVILFLDNNKFQTVDMTFDKSVSTKFKNQRDKLEKDVVKLWNDSQPNMKHKVVRVKLMRNK